MTLFDDVATMFKATILMSILSTTLHIVAGVTCYSCGTVYSETGCDRPDHTTRACTGTVCFKFYGKVAVANGVMLNGGEFPLKERVPYRNIVRSILCDGEIHTDVIDC